MSAAVNSSFEFNCTTECTSDISWRYVSDPRRDFSLLTPACLEDGRCQTKGNAEMGRSLLRIDRVQFSDAGTYLCWTGTNYSNYRELSFNFTGNYVYIQKQSRSVKYYSNAMR